MTKARLELEIDLDIWKTLKNIAEPLIDTPEMALRRLLGMEQKEERARAADAKAALAAKQEQMTPKRDYYPYIIRALGQTGGKGRTRDIVARVGQLMTEAGKLTKLDQETIPSGSDIRWQNMIRWAHSDLVEREWLKEGSKRGVWELSREGWDVLRGMEG